jgi:hypothetical protein
MQTAARTVRAIQALCQLSYSPEGGGWEERPTTLASARITA